MAGGIGVEAALCSLAERTHVPWAVLDADGVFLFVNAAFAALFGRGASVGDFGDVECSALLADHSALEFRATLLPAALAGGCEATLHLWRSDRADPRIRVRLQPVRTDVNGAEHVTLTLEVLPDRMSREPPGGIVSPGPASVAPEAGIPVLPIADRVIVVPIVGTLDVKRSSILLRLLLSGISSHRAKAVILDVTGLVGIDQRAADALAKAVMAARLKGAHTIVSGMSPETSEALAEVIVTLPDIVTVGDLKTGLAHALARVGVKLETLQRRKLET